MWQKSPHRRMLFDCVEEIEEYLDALKEPTDIYFGTCARKRTMLDEVSRATCLWADFDFKDFDDDILKAATAINSAVLAPSFIIQSGHGFHTYWLLDTEISGERAREILQPLCKLLKADHTFDFKRVMRIPYTYNCKNPEEIAQAIPVKEDDELKYSPADMERAAKVSQKSAYLVATGELKTPGEKKALKSRSERDWFVLRELASLGFEDATVKQIFTQHKIRDRYVEENWRLFDYELNKARGAFADSDTSFFEQNECWYYNYQSGPKQVSTFIFEPLRLIESMDQEGEDCFVGRIRSSGRAWNDVVFPKSAFSSSSAFIKNLPTMFWHWLGTDNETKQLLSYLMQQLTEKGMPQAKSTVTIGRHEDYWVTPESILTATQTLIPNQSPYVFIPRGNIKNVGVDSTVPGIAYPDLGDEAYGELVRNMSELLPTINKMDAIVPILGWFMAAPFKVLLRRIGVRFPHLNVFGTKGSGKTATLLTVFMPMLGVVDPRTWTPNTTTFVIRTLLASSNAFPIIFGEFRVVSTQGLKNDFLRMLLMAYDSGMDARGQSDLTTQSFSLEAPIIVDGEDSFSDPAARERSIIVNLHPETITENAPAFYAYQEFSEIPIIYFAKRFVQRTLLENEISIERRFDAAYDRVQKEISSPVPDRVRRNLAVVTLGIDFYNEFVEEFGGTQIEWDGSIYEEFLVNVLMMLNTGVSRSSVDDFIEDLVSYVADPTRTLLPFIAFYEPARKIMWFHLTSVMRWWEREQRLRGKDALNMTAIRAQLNERVGPRSYIREERIIDGSNIAIKGLACFGVSLKDAQRTGLSIPEELPTTVFAMRDALL